MFGAPVAHYSAAPVVAHYAAPAVVKTVTPVSHHAAPVAAHYTAPIAAYHHAPAVVKTVASVSHYAAPIVNAVQHENQHEERDGYVVKGYYSLVQPDGVTRTVHYSADSHNGFNAEVEYKGEPIVQKVVVANTIIAAAPITD
ncbi:PREDICTED: cuticle protein 18.6-like [Nicrophorus vespilloides]|uniref:Cuticle protein 18.6-like n=1 Tax=Nicrophorus vespilloides TaxID=110193 RepID=A0ABM1N5F4_NICVS|nr:PREDICTED: cuticle protein 18.6-like [Nicrophorus vespilloides]